MCRDDGNRRILGCILASKSAFDREARSSLVRSDTRAGPDTFRARSLAERRTVCILALANPIDICIPRASRSTLGWTDNRRRRSVPSRTCLSILDRTSTRSSRCSCHVDILAELHTCRKARRRNPICSDTRLVDGSNPEEGRILFDRSVRRTNRLSILVNISLPLPRRRHSASLDAERLVSRRLASSIWERIWVQWRAKQKAARLLCRVSR